MSMPFRSLNDAINIKHQTRSYLDEYKVRELVRNFMVDLVRAKSADPLLFMQTWAASKRANSPLYPKPDAGTEAPVVDQQVESIAWASAAPTNSSKRDVLSNLKLFVLDNSIRESTVGQTRGHTPGDKVEISKWASRCGFHHQVVAAFGGSRRVDDNYCENLQNQRNGKKDKSDARDREEELEYGEDPSTLWAFSEAFDSVVGEVPSFGGDETKNIPATSTFAEGGKLANVPVGLAKIKKYGLRNVIFEIDLGSNSLDWSGERFSIQKLVELLVQQFHWTRANFEDGDKAKVFVNLRDLPLAMILAPERVEYVIAALAQLDRSIRPLGILYEEPLGEYFADEVALWTRRMRAQMDRHGWKSAFQADGETVEGMLLVHVHKQWGMADAVVIDCLASGADGIWCSIAEEGAAQGHACSAVTIANLARLGNQDVVQRYQCAQLAKAAREVTRLTTESTVNSRQIVYGPRAIEAVFGFSGLAGGVRDKAIDHDGNGIVDSTDHFSLAKLFGVEDPPIRLSSLANAEMYQKR
jgi:hypothetical protein